MQSIDSIETYPYGTSKDLVCEKEEIKCNNIIKKIQKWLTLMLLQKKRKENNPDWPQIPDHSFRILIIGCSGSGKRNSSFNLINQQSDIDKIYLYAKGLYEASSIKFSLINEKVQVLRILMILKLFLNTQMIWMIFIKILKNTIQIRNVKYWSYLMTWLLT